MLDFFVSSITQRFAYGLAKFKISEQSLFRILDKGITIKQGQAPGLKHIH